MKNYLVGVIFALLLSLLAGCGGNEQGAENTDVDNAEESTEQNDQAVEEQQEEPAEEDVGDESNVLEFEQEIVNNDNLRATLIKVERIIDEDWDEERVEVTFEVENKRDETIEVQAREVSADNKMIDDSMLTMSQEVSSGKLADAVLKIQNYDGDLPQMEENIEMLLHVFSWDNMDYTEDHPVTINLK